MAFLPPSKRAFLDNDYVSGDDSDWNIEDEGFSSEDSDLEQHVSENENESNSSMDFSDVNEPYTVIAKDGTRWTEICCMEMDL